jgi:hypothetical protein
MSFSLFRGFGDIYDQLRSTPTIKREGDRFYIAEVIDTVLSKQHPKYVKESDLGKVLLREMYRDFSTPDEDITKEAWPIDLTTLKVPLPGEFVLVIRGLPADFQSDANIGGVDYYVSIISNLHLINYNGVPFGATLPDRVSKNLGVEGLNYIKQLQERHKKRFNTFIERQIKHIRPFDGDVIVQGRFGNSIRLGSTVASPSDNNPYGTPLENGIVDKSTWSTEGSSGDPIIIMRTAKADNIKYETSSPEELYTVENINEDGSSLYLCENQKVEVELQMASIGFKTWLKDLGIKPTENTTTVNDNVKQKIDKENVTDVDDPNDQGTNLNEPI